MSLGALEATVVSTAMPTVISTLGGLAHYSWVFSAYLLTSTACVPIWGRLSDLYGRRRIYLTGVAIFLVGSLLSGVSTTMVQLILSRAVQGLGAGCIIPLSMTIVGELYTLAERPRTQALFSGVWGLASIAGPLVGGYITDFLNWRWVFFLNLPFGLLAAAVIASAYPPPRRVASVQVDWLGAGLLFTGVSTLLIALGDETPGGVWVWVLATVVLLGAFLAVERRTPEPILPVDLFRTPVIARSLVGGVPRRRRALRRDRLHPAVRAGGPWRHRHPGRPGDHAALPRLGRHVHRRRQGDGDARLSNSLDQRQRADDARLLRPDARGRRFPRLDPDDELRGHRRGDGHADAVAAAGGAAWRRSLASRHRDRAQSVLEKHRRRDRRGGDGRGPVAQPERHLAARR